MTETPRPPEEILSEYANSLETTTRETIALMGLTGLEVQLRPGHGWSSTKLANKVVLSIDPLQITAGNRKDQTDINIDEAISEITEADQTYILHTICHELGHVRDFIDPTHIDQPLTKSDHFFWNAIDDAIIDKRLRTIPALDICTEELYSKVLFPTDSYLELPQHVQLMYGLLVNSVTGSTPELAPDVQEIIDNLRQVTFGNRTYDIMQVLADRSTSLEERRQIAEKFIKPYYDNLLVEDQDQNSSDDLDEQYELYEQIMHPGHSDHQGEQDKSGEEGEHNNKVSESDAESGIPASMSNCMEQIGKMLLEQNSEINPPSKEKSHKKKPSDKAISKLGIGGIAAELQLPFSETQKYLEALIDYRQEIYATAKAFETLSLPSQTASSPRFTNKPSYSGHKLHTGRVAQAAVQLETGSEQAIWRPIEHRGKNIDFTLGKLDVHLLVDISESMSGENAQQASVTAMMLMEGLELARHNQTKNNIRYQKPDVRLQITAFGSSHKIIAPLSYSPDPKYKGQTFVALRNPNSASTYVCGALDTVKSAAIQHPDRKQLVLIISDGAFYDYNYARLDAESLKPRNTQIIQFVIGWPGVGTITDNASFLSDAKSLPLALKTQLVEYMKSLQS